MLFNRNTVLLNGTCSSSNHIIYYRSRFVVTFWLLERLVSSRYFSTCLYNFKVTIWCVSRPVIAETWSSSTIQSTGKFGSRCETASTYISIHSSHDNNGNSFTIQSNRRELTGSNQSSQLTQHLIYCLSPFIHSLTISSTVSYLWWIIINLLALIG